MREPVRLRDFRPKSMLNVPETHVSQARFPAIDFHTHLTWSFDSLPGQLDVLATREDVTAVMERCNVRTMVNLTAGHGEALQQALTAFPSENAQFICFTEPMWREIGIPGYAQRQADAIVRAHAAGARGLKILKVLGLTLRDAQGRISIDDPRFDLMWEAAGSLGMPVTIHSSDPEAFFAPPDENNERIEELEAHPDWCFCSAEFPASRELHAARDRVVARHPRTNFVCAHVACAEDLAYVSDCLTRYPNMYVDISARIGELGRQPRASRRFFEAHQDRILFGTDAIPGGALNIPAQLLSEELYQIYFRFLETTDEYFDYAPAAAVYAQGRWRIYGIDLPDGILQKVYSGNSAKLLGFID